jgi:hypothetical protein
MFSIKNSAATFGSCLVLSVCASAASYAQSPKPASDVNVVNTPGVNVTNTPNVNVANAPNVKVTNTPTVRDADNPVRQPVEAQTSCTVTDLLGTCSATIFTVPSGKRLVIEFVTMNGHLPTSGEVAQLIIQTTGVGANRAYFLPLTAPAVDFFSEQNISAPLAQQVRIYAEEGTSIVMKGRHNLPAPAMSGSFSFSLSGYLVDKQ